MLKSNKVNITYFVLTIYLKSNEANIDCTQDHTGVPQYRKL
jgi:hypothetical protein